MTTTDGLIAFGPCVLCGAANYPLSHGGPTICPACDCGYKTPKRQANELRRLRECVAELEMVREQLELERDTQRDLTDEWSGRAKHWREYAIGLADLPAVRVALGADHVGGCMCRLCRIDAARSKP